MFEAAMPWFLNDVAIMYFVCLTQEFVCSYVSFVRIPSEPPSEPHLTGTVHRYHEPLSWNRKLHGTRYIMIIVTCES